MAVFRMSRVLLSSALFVGISSSSVVTADESMNLASFGCTLMRQKMPAITESVSDECRTLLDNAMLKPLSSSAGHTPATTYVLTPEDTKLLCDDKTCSSQIVLAKKLMNETGCLLEIATKRAEAAVEKRASQAGMTTNQFKAYLVDSARQAGKPIPTLGAMAARYAKQLVGSNPLLRLDSGWACAMSEDGKERCASKYSREVTALKSTPLDPTPEDAVKSLCGRLEKGGCCLAGGKFNELSNGVTFLSGMLYSKGAAPTAMQQMNATAIGNMTYVDMCAAFDVKVPSMGCKPNNYGVGAAVPPTDLGN